MSDEQRISLAFNLGMLFGVIAVGAGIAFANWLCPFPSKPRKSEPEKPWPITEEQRRQAILMSQATEDDWKRAIDQIKRERKSNAT